MHVRIKRVYEAPAPEDGVRVLIDRLWPRGLTKARVKADLWLKEAAPSTGLRTWFDHEPERWDAFRQRYLAELADRPALSAQFLQLVGTGTVTLIYAARDPCHNHAVILAEHLRLLAEEAGQTASPAHGY